MQGLIMKEHIRLDRENRTEGLAPSFAARLRGNALPALLTMLLGLEAHAADPGSALAGDLGRLQGRWTASAGLRRDIRVVLEIKGRAVTVDISMPRGQNFQVEGELALDETTRPRSLAWTRFMAPGEQPLPEIQGVYKIDGDIFTVCNGGLHGTRPKEFKRGDHPLADLVVFQRLKPDEPKVRTATVSSPRVRRQ
jgi:uncharacterized protein (TIGR03067 family)